MPVEQLLIGKRQEILRIAAEHGAQNVRLFGSAARGEASDGSDVDFPCRDGAGTKPARFGGAAK